MIISRNDEIVLIRRGGEPFIGKLALPGGFVDWGETVENAAVREAKEETGLDVELEEILGVYSDPKRDPRGHSASVVFVAGKFSGELKGGSDAKEAEWFKLGELDPSQFGETSDHLKIIQDFIKWKKEKGTYWSGK